MTTYDKLVIDNCMDKIIGNASKYIGCKSIPISNAACMKKEIITARDHAFGSIALKLELIDTMISAGTEPVIMNNAVEPMINECRALKEWLK